MSKLLAKVPAENGTNHEPTADAQLAGPLGGAIGATRLFRRLKPSEVVVRGDYVANERLELEPWDGPGGFRAGAFVKPIYRRRSRRGFAART
jgi:hypothetical protein